MATNSAIRGALSLAMAGLGFLSGPGASEAQLPSIPRGDVTIELELVTDGLTAPVYAIHAGD